MNFAEVFHAFACPADLPCSNYGRQFVEYVEDAVYTMLKYAVGKGPIYAALGNHDLYPDVGCLA